MTLPTDFGHTQTFLPGEFDLPDSLVRDITLLRSIPDLREKQSCLVPILDARAAIDLVLHHEQPSIYWHTLMDALTQVSNVSIAATDTGRRLRETKGRRNTYSSQAHPGM